MKKYIFLAPLAILSGMGLLSCSSQNDDLQDLENSLEVDSHTVELKMNITKTGFDEEPSSRSADAWANGDTVYLIFDTESGKSYGDAVYNNGTWQLTYFGSLVSNTPTKCQAVYVDNPGSEMGSVIVMNSGSCAYEDTEAQYVYEGDTLSVTATLSPKTGRIRFEGETGTKMNLYGISCYTAFDTATGNYTSTSDMLTAEVSDSYTDYIYGYFTDSKEPRLNVIYTASAFTRQFPSTIYQAGESGYVTLPTTASHSGWRNNAIFNINGVDLTMIPVEYENGNFLLAETETTEELYYAVTGNGNETQLPITYVSNFSTFLTQIYQLSRINFRLPTLAEWKYAYQGGNKSQGFTYSGSNNIYDVAWFSGNSGNELHPVKQLLPNELGFYDMSGNAAEATLNGNWYGGYYKSNSSECTPQYNTFNSSYYDGAGYRLALSIEN